MTFRLRLQSMSTAAVDMAPGPLVHAFYDAADAFSAFDKVARLPALLN